MRGHFRRDLEHQVLSLERRVRAIQNGAAEAAKDLLARAGRDRRGDGKGIEREYRRLQGEVERLEREAGLADPLATQADVERHVDGVERQLRDVLDERNEWTLEAEGGRRRRTSDQGALDRLRDEQERLTAELLRCAHAMRRHAASDSAPPMRRVWKALRLSGC
jgi:chromosome segregation ATPase